MQRRLSLTSRFRVSTRTVPAIAGLVAVSMLSLTGCGQARVAAAPEPQFTHGADPVPSAPESTLPTVTAEQPSLDDVEAPTEGGDVEQMQIIDDAGVSAPNASGWATFDETLSARLVPGDVSASVAVMIDGEIVHQAAYGDRIAGSGEPAETGDRFRVASVSKLITSIVVLQLVEEGVLTLDDPVGQILIDQLHLTQFDADVPGITVRELLSHTAGFPDHQSTFFGNGATSYTDAVRIGLSSSVGSGGGYNYSNMGFAALSVLIEAVTGQTYERVIHERLLDPLGLSDMRMTGTFEIGPDEVSHHPTPGRNYMEALGGAGAWNATPGDLVTIINSIDPKTPGDKMLSADTLAAMRYRVPTGQPPGGYGLGVINYSGDAWGHTGTIEHAHTMLLVQPDGVTWAISVSGDNPSNTEALRSIMANALGQAFPG